MGEQTVLVEQRVWFPVTQSICFLMFMGSQVDFTLEAHPTISDSSAVGSTQYDRRPLFSQTRSGAHSKYQ
jgi:hypothetical protein